MNGTGSLRSHPSRSAYHGVLRRGARATYVGGKNLCASRWLKFGKDYTVAWCGEYLDQTCVRLREVQGFTFKRSLFARAA